MSKELNNILVFVLFDITSFQLIMHYSEPTHNGDPVVEVVTVQGNQVHFIDVNNAGLTAGTLNQTAYELWSRIEQQVI